MSYEKIRKLSQGSVMDREIEMANERKKMAVFAYLQAQLLTNPQLRELMSQAAREAGIGAQNDLEMLLPKALQVPAAGYVPMTTVSPSIKLSFNQNTNKAEGGVTITEEETTPEQVWGDKLEPVQETSAGEYTPVEYESTNRKELLMKKLSAGMSIAGNVANIAINQVDQATMGDKNFSANSLALDAGVHGLSGALMNSGNPYCVCAGTQLYTNTGYKNIEDVTKEDLVLGYYNKTATLQPVEYIHKTHLKRCVQIETENGNILRCSLDHPIFAAPAGRAKYITVGKKHQRRIKDFLFKDAGLLKEGDYVAEIGEIPIFGNTRVKLAYLIGMLIGDGTYGKGKAPRLFTGDPDTWKYVENLHIAKLTKSWTDSERYNNEFREYSFNGLLTLLRELGIYGQTKDNKRLPANINQWDKQSCAELIAGLIDTDGCVQAQTKDHSEISFCQKNKNLLLLVKLLLLKFGIHSFISQYQEKVRFIKGKKTYCNKFYNLIIKRRESVLNFYNNITLNILYKQNTLLQAYLNKLDCAGRDTSYEFHNVIADRIKRIIPLGLLPTYNLLVGLSHTYIANNIITHNCIAAGVALEGLNFATKAGGRNVQGYSVNINNSGYGNLDHQESEAGRIWDRWSGATAQKLRRRNAQARMALNAQDISQDQAYQTEARTNSIDNVLRQNQIALAGGIDTSLLGN